VINNVINIPAVYGFEFVGHWDILVDMANCPNISEIWTTEWFEFVPF